MVGVCGVWDGCGALGRSPVQYEPLAFNKKIKKKINEKKKEENQAEKNNSSYYQQWEEK